MMLIPSLLVAVCAGWSGPNHGSEHTESQEKLAVALTRHLGTYRVAAERSGKPVSSLTLIGNLANDKAVERLQGLPQLEDLSLVDTHNGIGSIELSQVTDAGLARLKVLKHLRSLTVDSSQTTDVGLAHIGEIEHLHELTIGGCQGIANITDAGLKHLHSLSQLQALSLQRTRVTDAGLKELNGLPQLRRLNLILEEGAIVGSGFMHLRGLQHLESLSFIDGLFYGPSLDPSLGHLRELPGLESLTIFSHRVTDAGLEHLGGMTQLKKLSIGHSLDPMPVTDRGLKHLTRLRRLEDWISARPTSPEAGPIGSERSSRGRGSKFQTRGEKGSGEKRGQGRKGVRSRS